MVRNLVYTQARADIPICAPLPPGYEVSFWRPGFYHFIPPGLPLLPFVVWWILHVSHIFANRDYGVLLIHFRSELVHRSLVSPRYFRFPFMGRPDLQIGDTWTSEQHRGKGLARFAIQSICLNDADKQRKYWYVCDERNLASISVVEKLGFRRVGVCVRVPRFGSRLLGAFAIITEQSSS